MLKTPKRADLINGKRWSAGTHPASSALLLLALLAPLLALASGCQGSEPAVTTGTVVFGARAPQRPVRPVLEPALMALRAAMADGDDEYAFSILDGVRTRARGNRDILEVLARAEAVLEGRRLVRSLSLGLRVEPVAIGKIGEVPARRFRLLLDLSHTLGESVALSLPPGSLERLRVTIDPIGSQTKNYQTRSLDLFGDLFIEPDETSTVELNVYNVPFGASIAVRDQWDLQLLSGVITLGEADFPAGHIAVKRCERVSIAPYFPRDPVAPQMLIDYIAGDKFNLPALLERAVRIEPEFREEALTLLAPVVERLAAEDPERLSRIAPALSWLARRADSGTDWNQLFHPSTRGSESSARPQLDIGDRSTSRQTAPGGKLDLP